MSENAGSVAALTDAIRDGSFPNSNDLLASNFDAQSIQALVDHIQKAKEGLSHDIRLASQDQASDVDLWIAQAKQAQEDISRCKQEARQIIESHQQLETLRATAFDAVQKNNLLQNEIIFTDTLAEELTAVASIYQESISIQALLSQGNASEAAKRLRAVRSADDQTRSSRPRRLLRENSSALNKQAINLLEADLGRRILTARDDLSSCLAIYPDDGQRPSIQSILSALEDLEALPVVAQRVADKVEAFVYYSLRRTPGPKLASHSIHQGKFEVRLSDIPTKIDEVNKFVLDFLTYLHSDFPVTLQIPITEQLLPKLVSTYVQQWLEPAIPTELGDLDQLDKLQQQALDIVKLIESFAWTGGADLATWAEGAPRAWVMKRKGRTLDAVRHALVTSTGVCREVERVERQLVSTGDDKPLDNSEDWDADWSDEHKAEHSSPNHTRSDDDTSGWGFDEDDDNDKSPVAHRNGHEEASDDDVDVAWGWGDENVAPAKTDTISKETNVNGTTAKPSPPQEVVLTELYSITDVPDHVIDVVGKDIQDAITVQQGNHASLRDVPAAAGLLGLPTLALAMFRAIAPTHYSNTHKLKNMNLYNDSRYIAEKLQGLEVPTGLKNVNNDITAMQKFARSAYAREMDIQRTILADLLDGAQGFANCTQFPYSQEIENAVSSTTDRLRQVHRDWRPILSTSALLQSIGALLNMIIGKLITDIEEMEDISEAQSKRLSAFCTQVSELEDLFISRPPANQEQETESVPMTAVYTSNWLRFQYLINILDSSLVDIKFLWTEGEMSLEFSQDEVVDLIKALFADSSHRRSAIATIKGHRGSGI